VLIYTNVKWLHVFISGSAFSALTLLVGHHEEHLALKKLSDGVFWCCSLSAERQIDDDFIGMAASRLD